VVVPGQGDAAELVVAGELVLYPNPYHAGRAVADGVTLVGLAPDAAIVLLDAAGREVLRQDAKSDGTAFISVRGNPALASGVYVVRLESAAGARSGGTLAILR
jgi:hypothetical protein